MRKLIVLAVVLAFASGAEAHVLSWSVDAITFPSISATVVVQLASNDADPYPTKYVGHTAASPQIASIVSIVALPAAGQNFVEKGPYPDWWTVEAADFPPGSDRSAGPHWSVTIKGLAIGTEEFSSDDLGANDILEITVVPEPSSVLLLSLGALAFLRKRR